VLWQNTNPVPGVHFDPFHQPYCGDCTAIPATEVDPQTGCKETEVVWLCLANWRGGSDLMDHCYDGPDGRIVSTPEDIVPMVPAGWTRCGPTGGACSDAGPDGG
jgi:hypothetical protein